MSSHHIVKDNQEPALIIANGEACSGELISQLLEWSPVVMVLDGALSRVIEMGIKIDIVLGDFDREHHPEKWLEHQHNVEIIYTPDQDKTDLEKGIDFLIGRNHKAINIIWATGKRSDHTLNNISTLAKYTEKATLVMYDDYSRIYCLPKKFDKWYKAGTPLSLMPIGKVSGITTQGLKYNLENDYLELGNRTSSSNEADKDGTVYVVYQTGCLLMMECWDRE